MLRRPSTPGALACAALALSCGRIRSNHRVSDAAAARFLEQAAFGPSVQSVFDVKTWGLEGWLDQQFATPPSTWLVPRDLYYVQQEFFANAISGQDQLRLRVAYALSQIFVVSGLKNDEPKMFVPWIQLLERDAFSNYETLLRDVTLSPAMGQYLDMVNNEKADPVAGTNPNENYAREILQLFSVGLTRLNPDGTPQLDAAGQPVPTYGQDVIQGFAQVFTGWTFPTEPGKAFSFPNPESWNGPMELAQGHHDTNPKLLLRGVTLPAGQSGEKDLADAIHNVATDPNVGPFLSFRLIQRLVKSNPTPAYVGRVAAVWNDDGHGQRGNLRAVVRALLLDPEARQDAKGLAGPTDGKLREPALLVTGLLRALGARTDGSQLSDYSDAMRQRVFYPTTVFNYYPPDYKPAGLDLYGPEFKLRTGPAVLAWENFVNDVVHGYLPKGTTVDLSGLAANAGKPDRLVAELDAGLLRGMMSDELRASVFNAIAALPADNPLERAQAGVYLVALSSEFQIQR